MARTIRSVLIVRLSAIGDVIHALPVLEELRRQMPDVRVGWIAEEFPAQVLQHHAQIDCLYTVPKKRWRGRYLRLLNSEIRPFFRKVREDKWDAALDLQGLSKSGIAAWASGARTRVGFAGKNSREIDALFCTRRIKPHREDVHVVQQNLRLLEGFGLRFPGQLPLGSMSIQDAERDAVRQKLFGANWRGEPLLIVNPGAGFPSKKYPPEHYAALARLLSAQTSLRPLVLWGPGEESDRDTIAAALHDLDPVISPPTTVREMAVLISFGALFLGGDTGPSQLAGLLSVPVISIFGSTEWSRNGPWTAARAEYGISIQREDLACAPCWERRCPLVGEGHMACLRELHPDQVFERLRPWLATLPKVNRS